MDNLESKCEKMDVDPNEDAAIEFTDNFIAFMRESQQRRYIKSNSILKYFGGKPETANDTYDSGYFDTCTNTRTESEIPTEVFLKCIDRDEFNAILQNSLEIMCRKLQTVKTSDELRNSRLEKCLSVCVELVKYLEETKSCIPYASIAEDFVKERFLTSLNKNDDKEFWFALHVVMLFGSINCLNVPIISVLLESVNVVAENTGKLNGDAMLIFLNERDLRRQLEIMMVIHELREKVPNEKLSPDDEEKCIGIMAQLCKFDDYFMCSTLSYKLTNTI